MSDGDRDLRSIQQARALAGAAREAARILAGFTQEQLDSILDAMQAAALPRAQEWADSAVAETGFGNAHDKRLKNLFSTVDLYRHIRPMRTVGVLREEGADKVVEIASPVGVVAAIIPSTNPTSTAIYKVFISLKAGNAVVLSPHPYAQRCVHQVAQVLAEAAGAAGAPEGAVACMTDPALEGTTELMRHPAVGVILATGGTGLVRAAYSSGKPAYGVGPGNVPAFVDRSADVAKAARDIIAGKTFDNGVLCSSENAVIADAPISAQLVSEMTSCGAHFLDDAAAARLSAFAVRPDGSINTRIVGKTALEIAAMAGIDVPGPTRCLVARLTGVGRDHPLSREKLSPILAYYEEDGWEACCHRVLEVLQYGGMGHTMSIHSQDRDLIMKFARTKPVFRICVNTLASVGAVGLTTGLEPSMTLGCGALGGNITSDNIMPRHLINVKRLAFETRPFEQAAAPGSIPAPAPSAAAPVPAPVSARNKQGDLRARLRQLLGEHPAAAAPRQKSPAAPHPAPAAQKSDSPAVSFVAEADVRLAVAQKQCITINSRTIITPAARDLGEMHRVFRQI